jgi:hypothetical protein
MQGDAGSQHSGVSGAPSSGVAGGARMLVKGFAFLEDAQEFNAGKPYYQVGGWVSGCCKPDHKQHCKLQHNTVLPAYTSAELALNNAELWVNFQNQAAVKATNSSCLLHQVPAKLTPVTPVHYLLLAM